ncbi:NAD(P)H-quinone oxidoreductase subunit O [Spirulina sp. CS-785/01]|uniref:NAD(P)H-quinone oxidoreductase subunit O n=1 Tax=Spirulina sp. CS-785/01 TaxID=3021716 RepID=UPI00232C9484|nr:NAD(P)H-quinone oxidoreductase subunit O [Spirulina sp. CS-785/01]MDB9312097.1 NAD(P)H-quinone oxidoreductase subunit O [Spirulina sp. CS-785/01]
MAKKLKRGSLVHVVREQLENSIEAKASDTRFPAYLFESKGEIVETEGDYAFVKFYVPTPGMWLRLDQLEAVD